MEIDPHMGLGPQPPLMDPWGMPISAPVSVTTSLSRNQVSWLILFESDMTAEQLGVHFFHTNILEGSLERFQLPVFTIGYAFFALSHTINDHHFTGSLGSCSFIISLEYIASAANRLAFESFTPREYIHV